METPIKIYAIFLLVFLGITILTAKGGEVVIKDPSFLFSLDQRIKASVRERYQYLETVLAPSHYNALTHIEIENRFYFDKTAVDALINRRFYAKELYLEPGIYYIVVTGYSSTVAQCGPNPFITASGQGVRDGIIATNFLPFGAEVKIPEIFGDKVFEVQDRMAQRYWGRIDVWFPNYSQASRFSARRLKIEIL